MQYIRKLKLKYTDALKNLPIDLSIYMDSNGFAKGHVLIDDENESELYEIRVESHMISFK